MARFYDISAQDERSSARIPPPGVSHRSQKRLGSGLSFGYCGLTVKYQRFRLQIVAGPAASFMVHAWSPRGEGRALFIPPFRPEEAGALQTALWRSVRHLTAEEGDEPTRSPASIGEQLFTSLFPGEILRLYERSQYG